MYCYSRAAPVEDTEVITYIETYHVLELQSDPTTGEDFETVVIEIIGHGPVIHIQIDTACLYLGRDSI